MVFYHVCSPTATVEKAKGLGIAAGEAIVVVKVIILITMPKPLQAATPKPIPN